jgi:hypothetical protein
MPNRLAAACAFSNLREEIAVTLQYLPNFSANASGAQDTPPNLLHNIVLLSLMGILFNFFYFFLIFIFF